MRNKDLPHKSEEMMEQEGGETLRHRKNGSKNGGHGILT